MITFDSLLNILAEAHKENMPFVAYNKPNSDIIQTFIQRNDEVYYVNDFNEIGFVFAPFDSKKEAILIPSEYSNYEESLVHRTHVKTNVKSSVENSGTARDHISFVEKTIDFIKTSKVSKIVVARFKEFRSDDFDPIASFIRMVNLHRNATCYIWFHPNIGLWMGATPETLLEIEDSRFKTMSLAGTQAYHNSLNVQWGAKEINEQQLVTDYVMSSLDSISLRLQKSDTYTTKAGSLLHLRTDIDGMVSEKEGIASLVRVLHPTPAVCGYPRETSKEFIFKNEKFNRSFYTGFLGELNIDKKSFLCVNLRCLEMTNDSIVRLYVGGGITDKSDAELEWQETVAKCKTMESIL